MGSQIAGFVWAQQHSKQSSASVPKSALEARRFLTLPTQAENSEGTSLRCSLQTLVWTEPGHPGIETRREASG